MRRGYISGRNRVQKRERIKAMGVVDEFAIREDVIPPKKKPKDWPGDYSQRPLAIGDLREGDELCIVDLLDLGPAIDDALICIGKIFEKGATLLVDGEPEPFSFNSTEDAALMVKLAEMVGSKKRNQARYRLAEGRKKSKAKTGTKPRFETDLKPHRDALYAIWGKKIIRADAHAEINDYLEERKLKSISLPTLDKQLGAKTEAEAEFEKATQ